MSDILILVEISIKYDREIAVMTYNILTWQLARILTFHRESEQLV